MIKCNLAVLLAERGLKMADIINDTTLSKTAVRGLYYNESKGIQFETLETICDYLNVTPGEVINKIRFSVEIIDQSVDNMNETIDYTLYIQFGESNYKEKIRVKLHENYESPLSNNSSLLEVAFEIQMTKDFKQNVFSQITFKETNMLDSLVIDDFISTMKLNNYLVREVIYIYE
ncbi:helix-turn-helix transcriptional regulator [Viridibacillus arvi]|uniref:helix-turn-helix domain-containing protein n=1 Tax=Viridibacillus arvi TaxID=263475 RepID=UPI003D2B9A9A